VLEKSAVYSSFLKTRMEEERARRLEAEARARSQAQDKKSAFQRKAKGKPAVGRKRARIVEVTDDEEEDAGDEHGRLKKKKKGESGGALPPTDGGKEDELPLYDQPVLVTGGKLKNYQLEGLQWMVSLDQNGISGILGVQRVQRSTLLRLI
jgi:ATP-dependent DNA helicase